MQVYNKDALRGCMQLCGPITGARWVGPLATTVMVGVRMMERLYVGPRQTHSEPSAPHEALFQKAGRGYCFFETLSNQHNTCNTSF